MNLRDGPAFGRRGVHGVLDEASVDWSASFDSARSRLLLSEVRKRRLPRATWSPSSSPA